MFERFGFAIITTEAKLLSQMYYDGQIKFGSDLERFEKMEKEKHK